MTVAMPHADYNEPSNHASPQASGASPRLRDPYATENEVNYSTIMHILAVLGVWSGLPAIAAVVMWVAKKKTSPFVDDHGREVVNLFLTSIVFWIISIVTFGIFSVIYLIWAIWMTVSGIQGAMVTKDGEYFRYPMVLRFI